MMSLYRIQSGVSLENFRDVVSAPEDNTININALSQLFEALDFHVLFEKKSTHQLLPRMSDAEIVEIRSQLSVLEERTGRQDGILRCCS
jgi:hypothetical protein